MTFEIKHRDDRARTGTLTTDHGVIETPAFMAVGTVGTVKSIEARELAGFGAQVCLSNAYHLYLRPGTAVLEEMGGLHKFMAWAKPILVDSGGFQVLSLAQIRTINEDGVEFRSHIDGSPHMFTPETVVDIQRSIGPDFAMPLDELVGWPVTREQADHAAERTWRWLQRALNHFDETQPLYGHEQTLVPIVQGSFFEDLRKREAERYAELSHPIYAIGGLAVGEETGKTREAIDWTTAILPEDRPRYAMGVGTPDDLLDAVSRGVDLFDCVVPTRNGRRAGLYTFHGRMNLRNAQWAADPRPVEEDCPCPLCTQYSRAYLRHLFIAGELLAMKLATAHNLTFYYRLLERARTEIREGTFNSWLAETSPIISNPMDR
ncbi:tRNA guanosine(34) transglycosylase Tgt [bacterium]|nr:tRNA guanosine(34) transglycosylase Tgt [bacterium]